MNELKDLEPMEVTPAERAFILIMRNLGNGYIEGVGVTKGQPGALKKVTERIDLAHKEQLQEALTAFGDQCLVPNRASK